MSLWLSEKDFDRESGEAAGVAINVAFLQEIKEDYSFRELLTKVYNRFNEKSLDNRVSPSDAAKLISDLRDELETYFALEEFYGYFSEAAISNPIVSQKANKLQDEHQTLFLGLSEILESAEKMVYRESGPEVTIECLADLLEQFCLDLARHEEQEMELMMRLCNEEIGVGD